MAIKQETSHAMVAMHYHMHYPQPMPQTRHGMPCLSHHSPTWWPSWVGHKGVMGSLGEIVGGFHLGKRHSLTS